MSQKQENKKGVYAVNISPDLKKFFESNRTDFDNISKVGQLSRIIWLVDDATPRYITTEGREAQALFYLWKAGKKGITAQEVSSWALRLASYIHALRHEFGLDIRTVRELQRVKGEYGRYILETPVTPLCLETIKER